MSRVETAFSSEEAVGSRSVAWLLVTQWSAWATEEGQEAERSRFFENSANSGYVTLSLGAEYFWSIGDDGKHIDASRFIT